MFGRYELAVHRNGCRTVSNFMLQTQGPATYSPGFTFVNHTRQNQVAEFKTFEFNDIQAYVLEFTNEKLRFYRNEGSILESDKTITGITNADPGVVTITAHGFLDGEEVFISGVKGMTAVNGKYFIVANKTANTFELTDVDGNNVDTTAFTAYDTGGTAARVFEIDSPYEEDRDLFQLRVAQTADTMYITHPRYEPRKLTRTDHTAWTLELYDRGSEDPFLEKKVITAITKADPGQVTSNGHGYEDGDIIIIEGVVGMTEVNSDPYIVANKTNNTFDLTDLDGNNVATTGFTTYISDGYASRADLLPGTVAFYESRLWYGKTAGAPSTLAASRTPLSTGVPRYEDHTSGTDADHALIFTLQGSEVDKILWITATDRLLMVGTFGSIMKVTGSTDDAAITPTSIRARPLDKIGVADVAPINKLNNIIYNQKDSLVVKSFEFDFFQDKFKATDRNLVSTDITESSVKKMVWETGRPNIAWTLLNNGKLAGMTYEPQEGIAGWQERTTGALGEDDFITVAAMPRPSGYEQLWVVSERVVGGNTRRYVEFRNDPAVLPKFDDFFTGVDNLDADSATFRRAMQEAQKEYIHVDSAVTYDGSVTGAELTPGALTGTAITFTTDVNVFSSDDVGRELRKKAIVGVGTGRAVIKTFTDPQTVECDITEDFDTVDALADGNWYVTTDVITGLDHLEGRSATICADGSNHLNVTVLNGQVTLNFQASKVHVGLGYIGILEPLQLEFGGGTGPGQTKVKHVNEIGIRFFESIGTQFGFDKYKPQSLNFTQYPIPVGNPTPPITGVERLSMTSLWETDKTLFVRQSKPLPCTIQLLAIFGETDDN